MTAIARCLFVLSIQRKIGFLVMIKLDFLPFFGCVAGIALGAVAALMDIVNLMAADTLFWCVLVFLIDMT